MNILNSIDLDGRGVVEVRFETTFLKTIRRLIIRSGYETLLEFFIVICQVIRLLHFIEVTILAMPMSLQIRYLTLIHRKRLVNEIYLLWIALLRRFSCCFWCIPGHHEVVVFVRALISVFGRLVPLSHWRLTLTEAWGLIGSVCRGVSTLLFLHLRHEGVIGACASHRRSSWRSNLGGALRHETHGGLVLNLASI